MTSSKASDIRRDRRFIFKIEPGRETFEVEEHTSKVEKALRTLNQTRKSLSAEDSFLEQPGQLLDKALAKQIARREAELDSLSAPSKKNVSVIVRCSTPDPEVTCSKTNTASHFPDPDKVPEDFSLPLNHFFETFDNPEVPPLPPRHPVFHDHTPHVHSPAPQVPWTPPRQSHSVKKRGEISLLEGFQFQELQLC